MEISEFLASAVVTRLVENVAYIPLLNAAKIGIKVLNFRGRLVVAYRDV